MARVPKDVKEFTSFLKEANENSKPVYLMFSATWCGPCKSIAPLFHDLAKENKDKAYFIQLDVDTFDDLTEEYGIMATPTFVIKKDDKIKEQFTGASHEKLREAVARLV